LVKLTGVQISIKILPTCTSIQKSQPTFPNPEASYPGVGAINKTHTHCNAIFCITHGRIGYDWVSGLAKNNKNKIFINA